MHLFKVSLGVFGRPVNGRKEPPQKRSHALALCFPLLRSALFGRLHDLSHFSFLSIRCASILSLGVFRNRSKRSSKCITNDRYLYSERAESESRVEVEEYVERVCLIGNALQLCNLHRHF